MDTNRTQSDLKMEENKKETPLAELLPDVRSQELSVYDVVQSYRTKIINGEVDIAKAGVVLKKTAKVAEELLKDELIKMCILNATEKYLEGGVKTVKLYGASITKTAVFTGYDFKECGHVVLDELYAIQREVDARVKAIEAELKLLLQFETNKDIMGSREGQLDLGIPATGKNIIIDNMPKLVWENSGETVTVKAPRKYQTMGLKYSKL